MMTLDELLTLGQGQEATSSAQAKRRTFSLRKTVVYYPQYTDAIREVAKVHAKWRSSEVAEGVLLVGQSGCGKTTIMEEYAANFPRSIRSRKTVIPVLSVLTPEAPSVKSLAESFLIALEDPAASKGTTTTMTRRIIYFLKECEVELVMLDEFHHFFDGHRRMEGARVTNWLKNLFNAAKIPIVLFGLPLAILALNSNQQLRRRFCSPHYVREFEFETPQGQALFRGVLGQIQKLLPVSSEIDFGDPAIARRFYFASAGLIDYVIKVVDEAVSRVDGRQERAITLGLLGKCFRHRVWADAPDILNPFLTTAKLRRLDNEREPFELWDDPAQYTLSRRAAAVVGKSNKKAR